MDTPFLKSRVPRLFAIPKSDIAYNVCLYRAVEALGIEVVEGYWAGHWLLDNVRAGDLVHIHWPSFLYFAPCSRRKTLINLLRFAGFLHLLRRRGAQLVWTAHNLYPHEGGRLVWAHRVARRLMVKYADHVLAHGPTAAAIVAREFSIPAKKMRVIRHGHWIGHHSRTLSADSARQQLNIAADRYVYTFVGSCKPYKNLELLVESFAKLQDDSVLIIAGEFHAESYRQRIAALLARIPPARWRWEASYIEDSEVQRFVLAGDVLVLPYTEILTSGSAMLGLSFGRPVIAPDAGGLRDVVNNSCGLLYDATRPEQLLDALRQVRNIPYSEGAIIEHAQSFDWIESANVLAQLLRGRSARNEGQRNEGQVLQ